jgi:nitrogen PTS system EIIA component
MSKHSAIYGERPLDHATGMSTVADYTAPSLMVPFLRSRHAASLVAELCTTLHAQGRIADAESCCRTIIRRETLSSTSMSPGWAFPHARLEGIPQLAFALGRSSKPLAWFGGEPVNTVFLFAVPETGAAAYLGLISGLAKLSQDPLRLQRLGDAPDSRAMFEVLQEVPLPGNRAAAVHT